MDLERLRRIASKGGKQAHETGKAHEWTKEEAKLAGRKGGAAHRRLNRTENDGRDDIL